jgi:hypothetical protein
MRAHRVQSREISFANVPSLTKSKTCLNLSKDFQNQITFRNLYCDFVTYCVLIDL